MNHAFRRALLTCVLLCTLAAPNTSFAAEIVTVAQAVEAPANLVTLPSGATSSLVMAPCAGCPLKTFPTTASTAYYIGEQLVSLAELKAAVAQQPDSLLTVSYLVKTGELTRVTADPVNAR